MPTLSHPHLHGRPFGSALLSVSDFNAWLRKSNLHFPLPSLNDGDFFQIETLLVKVELDAGSISGEEAAAVVAADQFLAADPMADLNPRWLVGAEAHRKWRVRISEAVTARELMLLDFGSKLPIAISGNEMAPASASSSGEEVSAALAAYFDLPAHPPLILPDALEGMVRRVFQPSPFGAGYWMDLSPEVRRDVAAKWDSEHTEEAIAFAQADATAAFAESVNNGALINWRYWAEQMPTWTSAQASRLMCALDPDVFEDLGSRPNRNDPSKLTLKAKQIQRLADAQQIAELSPAEWLAWADKHKLHVHLGLRLEVGRQEALLAPKDAPRSAHGREPLTEPSPTIKGVTKAQILTAFGGIVTRINLEKAMGDGATKWLSDALISKGARGNGGRPAQWQPLILAVALHERKLATKAKLTSAFYGHSFLADWRDEWKDQEEQLT